MVHSGNQMSKCMCSWARITCGIVAVMAITLLGIGCGNGPNECKTYTWQTVFEDDFNSATLDPHWELVEGDTGLYHLNGEDIEVDDSDACTDGPWLQYTDPITADRVRITCKVRTEEMNGGVELAFGMRFTGDTAVYGFQAWDDNLAISRVQLPSETEHVLAADSGFEIGEHETFIFVCEYAGGKLSLTVKEPDGSIVTSIEGTDPSPLPAGHVLFMGEVDGTENEYLHFDDFKIEEWVCK